jgi:hypothetical protein
MSVGCLFDKLLTQPKIVIAIAFIPQTLDVRQPQQKVANTGASFSTPLMSKHV